jgi:hypothetical protein
MKFEVVEVSGGWIVLRDGVEVARHSHQGDALADIGARLRGEDDVAGDELSYSLAMRYQARA